jgi:hypothetical protein
MKIATRKIIKEMLNDIKGEEGVHHIKGTQYKFKIPMQPTNVPPGVTFKIHHREEDEIYVVEFSRFLTVREDKELGWVNPNNLD